MRSWTLGLLTFGAMAVFTAGCSDDASQKPHGNGTGGADASEGGSAGSAGTAGDAGSAGTGGTAGSSGNAGSSGAAGFAGSAGMGGTAGYAGSAGAGGSSGKGGAAGADAGIGGSAGDDGGTAGTGGTAGDDAGTGGTAGDDAGIGGSAGDDGGTAGTGGTAGEGGAAGTGGSGGNPVCDDAQKRCDRVFTYPYTNETSVELRGDFKVGGWSSGVPLTKVGAQWEAAVSDLQWGADIQYKYVVNGSQWVTDPNNPNTVSDGYGGQNSFIDNLTCTAWTCDTTIPPANDWADAVMYFVFVDRFLDGNPANNPPVGATDQAAQWRGGDWAGVKSKIEAGYFNDLGVNTLWISAPLNNTSSLGIGQSDTHQYTGYHGYWPTVLDQTEEHFGTMQELKDLVAAAHAKGLKVIVDYVMNHVHEDSPLYAAHSDWFWEKGNCICGAGCSWDGAEGKRCWFTEYLPDFNFTNAAARDYSVSNAVWWVQQTGVDGFRLDAVKHIEDQWLLDLRARIADEIEPVTQKHFYMVGETFTGDRNLIKYYVSPSMLDGQFEFPLRLDLINTLLTRTSGLNNLDAALGAYESYYGSSALMSTFIGNHDVPRSIHFAESTPISQDPWYGGKERAWTNQPELPSSVEPFERLANAFTVLFTVRGVPLVYYGDEIGMPGAGDPDNRRMMTWSGYSAGQQLLLDRIKKLGAARKAHAALRRGTRTTLSSDQNTILYRMQSASDTVYVAINRSDSIQGTGGLPASSFKDLMTGQTVQGPSISVQPRSSMVLIPQ